MLRVLIVDDHGVVRIGLKQLLLAGFQDLTVAEASNSKEALDLIAKKNWDVVLLDIDLPGRTGLDILPDIKALRPNLPVLILTACAEDRFAIRVLKSGASGFLSKESSPDELVNAVKKVIAGGKYITPTLAELLANQVTGKVQAAHESLSDREHEVLRKIAAGESVSEIAQKLCLSVKTVSTYRARILQKMGFKGNADITRYALERGIVK